jgi:DNA-binding transcriptional ArsR family regulator
MRRDVFQAIADPTRRAIILLIASQECQLVKQEQSGREIYYKLEVTKIDEIDRWLEQFRKIWESRFNELDDLLLTIKPKKK